MVIPSSTSHSQSTAASASSSPSNSPPERVAGRRKISTKKQQKREVIDPEGQELLRQIEEMRQKIAASEAVLVRVHEGERADLRRVQETKERKLRRVETTEKQRRAVPGSSRQEQQDESALKDKIKESQQIIKTLKRENAKIHTQNHQLKLQILTTASSNSLLQDQLEETRAMCSQAERHHKQHTEAEHDSLLRLVANYESGTMDLEDAIDGKASQLERVKKSRRQYEDRVDQIVEYLQQKCKDAQLVEEVVALADDDDGWDDCSSDDDDESQVCTKTFRHKRLQKLSQSTLKGTMPYKQSIDYDEAPRTPVDKDSPKSVSDLITLSSHSLHIFS
jgi:chromosome segregation ATPase